MQVHNTTASTSVRFTAVKIICAVVQDNRSLTNALSLSESLEDRDRAFCKELCYGTLRWYSRLEAILSLLLKKPFKAKDIDITVLALTGLYQIIYLNTPDHAAVSETVNACKKTKKPWAKNTLNAVLRRFLREKEAIEARTDSTINQQHAHPDWLVKQIAKDWPNELIDILTANNQRPPMSIRINTKATTRAAYLTALNEHEIDAIEHPYNAVGLTLKQAVNVERLPNFWQGACSVQDSAAQLAAKLLNVTEGQRVLDVCAAPGGKTAHIAESATNISLTAIDIDEQRNQKVFDNFKRLDLNANILTVDALQPNEWFDGTPFQRILLDAPCSATGVIRRHPDIKSLRQPDDITKLVELQQQLLQSIWPLLEKKGVLLYATCSILADENSRQIERFMTQHHDAKEIQIPAKWGRACTIGRQILPGEDNMDGFYYALITKV
ncbi:MAG: 16S rRNA (cytosine(967)-C(5))-methyltransferase [Piscirickettsiaceae bacterium]|nr:MAG: 16S rRNA (cytosine(967)-C(5))-methyltransferase [Piscirickettsiaceae bacterium]PCI69947.1 MAG: 16S rRNA (cytosine(967)-C(5))-methyltransferase [Piscirickettsiaceae bacterium]